MRTQSLVTESAGGGTGVFTTPNLGFSVIRAVLTLAYLSPRTIFAAGPEMLTRFTKNWLHFWRLFGALSQTGARLRWSGSQRFCALGAAIEFYTGLRHAPVV
jgi:hypothetical protein